MEPGDFLLYWQTSVRCLGGGGVEKNIDCPIWVPVLVQTHTAFLCQFPAVSLSLRSPLHVVWAFIFVCLVLLFHNLDYVCRVQSSYIEE